MINTGRFPRAIIYVAIFSFLTIGCSGGGGNPLVPASPGDMIGHPTQSGGGDVRRAIPAFSWTLNEPADLYEEGWGHMPATIATSFTFSATLGGTKSDWFDGKIFFSIDGEPRHFSFSNKVITADISGLEPGIHNVYLLAASAQGEAGRSFEFEVLDKPPSMQVGIGIDDGKLHISPDRPMPTSQLGDLSRWSIEGFLAEKRDIEVLPGNDEVVIGLTDERSFKDYMMYEPDGISPTVTFNSTLGEMTCKLFNDERLGGRHAQSGCTWGQLLPLEQCNDAVDGWTFDLQHFTSEERERREALYMLVDEGYVNGCFYTGKYSDSWSYCFNYVIVNYNWFWEGHLDPTLAANWDAQYDTLEYDPNNCGYKGVGYRNGRWEHYDRYRGYFPPSICEGSRHQWEVIIDCNNCNTNYLYGYMSKGWIWGEDLEVDSTCPEFDEIIAIPGEMLNDYVLNTLLSDDGLPIEGFVYNANHSTSGLWQYYYDRCGYLMEDWNQDNPGGICFVVKAHDVDSNQGRWIGHMLSIDLEYKPDHPDYPGERICLEDEQMHYFYVDRDFPAEAEVDDVNEIWPLYLPGSGCSNPLPIDGSPQGELSCWIIRAGCIGEDFSSARFRIKDDCGNWTRSENMVPDPDLTYEISDIGIIVVDKHEVSADDYLLVTSENEERIFENGEWKGEWNCAPVISRDDNSICSIDFAVQVLVDNLIVERPDYIDTEVNSPLDGQPDIITVRLFPVDPAEPSPNRHEFLDNLFGGAPEGKLAFYYDPGEVEVLISTQSSANWDHPLGWGPRLCLSDGPTLTKDFAIINSYASLNHYPLSDKLYYDNDPDNPERINGIRVNRRGLLFGDEYTNPDIPKDPKNFCVIENGELPCYVSDAMQWGFEPVKVKLKDADDYARIGVQSHAQVLFAMAHGLVWHQDNPDEPDKPSGFADLPQAERESYWNDHDFWDFLWSECIGIGLYYKGENNKYGNRRDECVKPEDLIMNEHLSGVDWLISTACDLLNHNSWPDWNTAVANSHLESICGFSLLASYSYPDTFWSAFSHKLSTGDKEHPIPIDGQYWHNTAHLSSDNAVRAWMQNACEHMRELDGGSGSLQPVCFASAVDGEFCYYMMKSSDIYKDLFHTKYFIHSE